MTASSSPARDPKWYWTADGLACPASRVMSRSCAPSTPCAANTSSAARTSFSRVPLAFLTMVPK